MSLADMPYDMLFAAVYTVIDDWYQEGVLSMSWGAGAPTRTRHKSYHGRMLENFDPTSIPDESLRAIVLLLMNEVERLSGEVTDLQEEVQRLRDENRRLKGEQGKPVIRPVTPLPSLSSEKERHVPRPHRKRAKKAQVPIDR